jgi:hypothetical protein
MTTRTVTGSIIPVAGVNSAQTVEFRLLTILATNGLDTVIRTEYAVTTDSNGVFSLALEVPDTGAWEYRCTLPDDQRFIFTLGAGSTITLEEIIATQIGASAIAPDALSTMLAGYQLLAGRGAANGYAPLDSTTKIDPSYLPIGSAVQVTWFGAVGDGVTDSTAAIQAAINASRMVYIPAGTYVTSAPLISTFPNQNILGSGGQTITSSGTHSSVCTIMATHTSGPVLQFKRQAPRVEGICIDATPTRRAAGNPLTTGGILDGHGILFGGDDNAVDAAVIVSRQRLRDVSVINQPTDGIHSRYGCEMSVYDQVSVSDCVRHGYVWDDGTTSGATHLGYQPFHWGVLNTRAIECGGNAFLIGSLGQTSSPIDFYSYNLEALGCAYDSNKRVSDYLVVCRCQGCIFDMPDFEDQQFANATTGLGNLRTARATPTLGVHVNSSRYEFRNPYFSSLLQSIEFAGGTNDHTVRNPRIFAGTYGIAQAFAFFIPVNTSGFVGKASTATAAGATLIFKNQSLNADIRLNGLVNLGTALTASDVIVAGVDDVANVVAITAGTAAEPNSIICEVDAESDTAPVDSLSRIIRNGFPPAQTLRLRAKTGETITVVTGASDSGTSHGIDLCAPTRTLTGTAELWLVYNLPAARWKEVAYFANGNGGNGGRLTGSVVYNPSSLNAGDLDTEQTLVITGVALGDTVVGASTSADLKGSRLYAYVSATDTVKFQFSNPTAGAVDVFSGTVRVVVEKSQ